MMTAALKKDMNPIPAELTAPAPPTVFRRAVQGGIPDILADIQQDAVNIAIWQRELSAELQTAVQALLVSQPAFKTEMTVTPQNVLSGLRTSLGDADQRVLTEDMAGLVDRFCELFQLKQVSLSLKALGQTMCPKFHTDRVVCRLLTTYQGVATEWLPHHRVDRSKLKSGSHGLADHQSGLFNNADDIQQLRCGDVALLKGELWQGNEQAGLVHRSPSPTTGERRLLLKLDFTEQRPAMM